MQITCFHCRQTWDVPSGQVLAAEVKFGLGVEECTFVCPNCGSRNALTHDQFKTALRPQELIPVTGTDPQAGSAPEERSSIEVLGRSAPTNPVPGPGSNAEQRDGIVLERRLHVRRGHSTHSEMMTALRKGEHVTIYDTWTDGENTWAQLGPERWALIEHDGDALIELVDE